MVRVVVVEVVILVVELVVAVALEKVTIVVT